MLNVILIVIGFGILTGWIIWELIKAPTVNDWQDWHDECVKSREDPS